MSVAPLYILTKIYIMLINQKFFICYLQQDLAKRKQDFIEKEKKRREEIQKVCLKTLVLLFDINLPCIKKRGHRGHERFIVGFTTTCAISACHH